MFYPLNSPSWDESEIEAAVSVLRSGRTTMGERTLQFEEQFAKYFGVRHAVFCSSGSSANLLAVAALTFTKKPLLRSGDEVLVPAVAWATTYFPLHQYGLKIKLVDIDLQTLNIDLEAAKSAMTAQTNGVMAVNLLGNPIDYNELLSIFPPDDFAIIEDNCESMGAIVPVATDTNPLWQHTGTFGKVGTFSTFFSHHICTGEGGVVVTDDDEIDQILRCLRSHGWTRELPAENHINKAPASCDAWQEKYRFYLPGYNLRPTEMAAAIGSIQLTKLPMLLEGRRKNAAVFHEMLHDLNKWDHECIVSSQKPVGNPSYYGFPLILRGRLEGKRKELVARLTEAGIETRPVMSGNIARHEVSKRFGFAAETCEMCGGSGRATIDWDCAACNGTGKYVLDKSADRFPVADKIDHDGLFVGNSHLNLEPQLSKLFEVVREFANDTRRDQATNKVV